LRDAGFSLAIDDFGTGYSSLSYLQKMPMTELKIDRSFVRHVRAGSEGAELLDSIIALGHRMGLRVVAEGAETAQEWALLQSLGCDYIQGWFVARAMPAAEFVQWRQMNDPFGKEASSAHLALA
jgi:EAL domain-containing protein (putative c-di-GMP-specific phosphodiesterase class I)